MVGYNCSLDLLGQYKTAEFIIATKYKMKTYGVFLALLVIFVTAQTQTICTPQLMTFAEFKTQFNITYNNNVTEDAIRNGYYDNNLAILANSTCCYCGVTKYFDRTPAELASIPCFI